MCCVVWMPQGMQSSQGHDPASVGVFTYSVNNCECEWVTSINSCFDEWGWWFCLLCCDFTWMNESKQKFITNKCAYAYKIGVYDVFGGAHSTNPLCITTGDAHRTWSSIDLSDNCATYFLFSICLQNSCCIIWWLPLFLCLCRSFCVLSYPEMVRSRSDGGPTTARFIYATMWFYLLDFFKQFSDFMTHSLGNVFDSPLSFIAHIGLYSDVQLVLQPFVSCCAFVTNTVMQAHTVKQKKNRILWLESVCCNRWLFTIRKPKM